ncbi:MAG: hypothetical protein GY850_41245 [bacterium]|nr:hypothetical protein [bacterium]
MDKFQTKAENQQFPWRGKFKAKQEIDNYFSGDKVLCLLCLNQVCKDDDMPGFGLVSKYAGAGRLPEDKFKIKLQSLQKFGLSTIEIARQLGVSKTLIRSRLD